MNSVVKSFILILTLLVLSFNVFSQEIQQIKKGESAQFDGFIIDNAMEEKMRTFREENKKLKEINVKLESLGELKDIRHEMYKQNNETLTDANNKLQTEKTLNGFLYFFLGTIVTGGIAYGVVKTLK